MGRPRLLSLAVLSATLIAVACTKHIARPPVEEVPIRGSDEAAPSSSSPTVILASSTPAKPSSKDKPDKVEAKPEKTADKLADKPDKPDAPATGAPGTPQFTVPTGDETTAEPPRDRAFPKTADTCKKDEDCAATNLALGGEFMCCTPCKPVAGTKGWVKKVEQVCAQKQRAGYRPKCAPWDCSKAEAECRGGKCVVK